MMIAAALSAIAASAGITISGVTARQRWPWNGLVDIDFTISGAATGEAFAIDIDATASAGAIPLNAKTYAVEPVAGAGQNRIVWDLGADYPNFRADDLRITVTATPFSDSTPVYMVIDLSGGSMATKYPVRYTTAAPAHVRGAANEPCQTTELWMKRIRVPNFAFTVNSYLVKEEPISSAHHGNFWGKMTKDYYIGVFELTQKQYQLVMGTWPKSYFTNELYRASRPVEGMQYKNVVGSYIDTQAEPASISPDKFLGKIRAKTGLPINLPSNIQLGFAARGGTRLTEYTEHYVYAVNGTIPSDRTEICRCKGNVVTISPERDCDARSGTAYVGTYLPNDYGLYDTLGNVTEHTCEHYLADVTDYTPFYRDYYQSLFGASAGNTSATPVIDPPGVSLASAKKDALGSPVYRLGRGDNYSTAATGGSAVTLWTMTNITSYNNSGDGMQALSYYGFRLSMTVE